jgi:hypothetical protein
MAGFGVNVPGGTTEQGSWSILLGEGACAGAYDGCSSYSMIGEDVSNSSWDILSATEQKDDGSMVSSSTAVTTISWVDVSKMPMPPNKHGARKRNTTTSTPSSARTSAVALPQIAAPTTTKTTVSIAIASSDAFSADDEREGVKDARGGRAASMFGKNKTRSNTKLGQRKRYDRHGEKCLLRGHINGAQTTVRGELSNQRSWRENRINTTYVVDDGYGYEEGGCFYSDDDAAHEDKEKKSHRVVPTLHEQDRGVCAICLEEKPLVRVMKACRSHPSACYDCLRQHYVINTQGEEPSPNNNYPLRCFWPGCGRVLRDTQIRTLVKSEEEMGRHFHMAKEAKVLRRQMQYDLECQNRKEAGETKATCKMLLEKNNNFSPEEFLSVMAALDGDDDGVALCATCGRLIVKNGGCGHMTCYCGHEFSFNEARDTCALVRRMITKKSRNREATTSLKARTSWCYYC